MNPPEAVDKRGLAQNDEAAPPPLKRKKTVTWAGDVPNSSAENEPELLDGPQSSGEEPGGEGAATHEASDQGVVVLAQGELDSLFAGLEEGALEQQENVPAAAAEELSHEALLQHRIDNIDRLYELYEAEMWSLYEELHVRHQQFQQRQQQQQQQQQAGAAASAPEGDASPAAAPAEPVDFKQLLAAFRDQQHVQAEPFRAQQPPAEPSGEGQPQQLAVKQEPGAGAECSGAEAPGAAAAAAPAEATAVGESGEAGGDSGTAMEVDSAGAPAEGQGEAAAGKQEPGAALPLAPGEGGAAATEEGGPPSLPLFEEVEGLIAGLGPDAVTAPRERLVERRAGFLRHLGLIGRLEASALGTLCRELDAHGALAALCGRRQRYLLCKTAVLLGRNTESQGKVDVDLSAEGHSQTVSRLQAALSLEPDGSFSLRCLGRRNLFVNGQRVEQGAAAVLPHLSLVKAGGVSLLFVANAAAVRRVLRRSAGVAI